MRFAPLCAKSSLFDTSCECFRAGFERRKRLISQSEALDQPLNLGCQVLSGAEALSLSKN